MKKAGWFMMKKGLICGFGISILLLVVMGCDSGDSDYYPPTPKTYTCIASSKGYELTITGIGNEPQAGDTYVLTIIASDGTIQTSTGTVGSASGGTVTLTPSSTSAPTFDVTVGSGAISAFSGSITLDGGGTNSPGVVSPPSTNPKQLTITGLPTGSNNHEHFQLYLDTATNEGVTGYYKESYTGTSVAEYLKTVDPDSNDDDDFTNTDWTGTGSFVVRVIIGGGIGKDYAYTGGKTFAELGLDPLPATTLGMLSKLPKYPVILDSQTVDMSKFVKYFEDGHFLY
jgi:hypothetical protein